MINNEQKVLDLIRMGENLIKEKEKCSARDLREVIRLYITNSNCLANEILKIKRKLIDQGFNFKSGRVVKSRLYEIQDYYNSSMNGTNDKEIKDEFEILQNKIHIYNNFFSDCHPQIAKFIEHIKDWCDNKYNYTIKEQNNPNFNTTYITTEIKFINQIRNDIDESYNEYEIVKEDIANKRVYFDGEIGNIGKERANKSSSSYKFELTDMVIINNTICTIMPCFVIDSNVSSEENERRMWAIGKNSEDYSKYHKYALEPDMIKEGFGLTMFDTLESLQNKVLSLGGKIYKNQEKK